MAYELENDGPEFYVDKHGRERMRVKHFISPEHKQMAWENFNKFFNQYFTDKSHMNRELGVSRNVVSWWFRNRKIGKLTAKKIGDDPKYSFSAHDLRPDVFPNPEQLEMNV